LFFMSRAFVKEPDDGDAIESLPDRTISSHPNFVTAEGLAQIEAHIARLQHEQAAAGDDRAAHAKISRDLRYWLARRSTAQVVAPPHDATDVRFCSTVTIERDDGRRQTFRIVGEDEADPTHGTLSHLSPLARALMGKSVGDVVHAGSSDAEIIAIA
jgi:transcription elongation GreA/GreB family factor